MYFYILTKLYSVMIVLPTCLWAISLVEADFGQSTLQLATFACLLNSKVERRSILDRRRCVHESGRILISAIGGWLDPILAENVYLFPSISSFFFLLNKRHGSQLTPSGGVSHPQSFPQVHPSNLQPMFVHGSIGGVWAAANSFLAAWSEEGSMALLACRTL